MDDVRAGVTDLDRAIAETLDVDVSPDFLARVRQRIANEPAPAPFWSGWRIALPIAAAAAVAIAIVGVAALSTRGPSAPPLLASRPLLSGSLPLADVRSAAVRRAAEPQTRSHSVDGVTVLATTTTEPDVLVPREEIDMYRRLIAQAQSVPGVTVVDAPEDRVLAGLISEITIDPIKIELIVPPVGGEGERK